MTAATIILAAALASASDQGAAVVRDDLRIPPPPAIPGAPAPPPEVIDPALAPLSPEEIAALEVAAAASPRVSNFADRRGAVQPPVPLPVMRVRQEIHIRPTEATVADRGAMSQSLLMQPADLRLPSNFTTLYEVEQRPDLLVRGNGAAYAVFPQGDYALAYTRKKQPYVQTLIPAGTIFYIGEPDWRKIIVPGIRRDNPNLKELTPEEWAAKEAPVSAIGRIEPTMPVDFDGVHLRPIMMEDFPGIGILDTRIETYIEPSTNAFAHAARRGTPNSDESILHPVLGPAAEALSERADPAYAAPPIHADSAYRQQRVSALLERAARGRTN